MKPKGEEIIQIENSLSNMGLKLSTSKVHSLNKEWKESNLNSPDDFLLYYFRDALDETKKVRKIINNTYVDSLGNLFATSTKAIEILKKQGYVLGKELLFEISDLNKQIVYGYADSGLEKLFDIKKTIISLDYRGNVKITEINFNGIKAALHDNQVVTNLIELSRLVVNQVPEGYHNLLYTRVDKEIKKYFEPVTKKHFNNSPQKINLYPIKSNLFDSAIRIGTNILIKYYPSNNKSLILFRDAKRGPMIKEEDLERIIKLELEKNYLDPNYSEEFLLKIKVKNKINLKIKIGEVDNLITLRALIGIGEVKTDQGLVITFNENFLIDIQSPPTLPKGIDNSAENSKLVEKVESEYYYFISKINYLNDLIRHLSSKKTNSNYWSFKGSDRDELMSDLFFELYSYKNVFKDFQIYVSLLNNSEFYRNLINSFEVEFKKILLSINGLKDKDIQKLKESLLIQSELEDNTQLKEISFVDLLELIQNN